MARSTVAVKFTGDVSSLQRSIGQVDGKLNGLKSGLGKLGKVAALGAGAAAVGIGAIGVQAVKSLARIERIGAQTDAVLKSTGGAAGVTRKEIDELAGSIEGMSGVEAEAITEGQNLLLTFTKVRNGVGKGNKIFDKATEAMVDMSVAMGTDMKSSSILLGKALNDPIKGITALTRAGVQFTEEQKAAIKSMVEMGDVAGAQKIILGELNTQFGGSAKALGETFSGRIERIKHQFGTLTETLATKLMPAAERLLTWASNNMPGAMAAVERAFERAKPHIDEITAAVKDFVAKALVVMKQWWDDNGPKVIAAVTALREGVVLAFAGLIEAGEFVIEHWDQFKYLAAVMAAAVVGHYVKLGVAAVASAATQASAWVTMKTAAVASKIETVAIIALMIADWVRLAAAAVANAARVAAAWVVTQLAALRAQAVTIAAATAQGGAWAGLAVAAQSSAAKIAASWATAAGAAGAVIAAAETINNLTGNKLNPNDLNLWERLDPRKAFKGIELDIPFFDHGGVMPGPRGRHSLAMVAGGETILPTHRSGFVGAPQIIQVVLDGRVLGEVLANRATVDNRNRAA